MKKIILLGIAIILLAFTGCKKEEEIQIPDFETTEVPENGDIADAEIKRVLDFGTNLDRSGWEDWEVPKEMPSYVDEDHSDKGKPWKSARVYDKVNKTPGSWNYLQARVTVKSNSISEVESEFITYMYQHQMPWTIVAINTYVSDKEGTWFEIMYNAPAVIIPERMILGETLKEYKERKIAEIKKKYNIKDKETYDIKDEETYDVNEEIDKIINNEDEDSDESYTKPDIEGEEEEEYTDVFMDSLYNDDMEEVDTEPYDELKSTENTGTWDLWGDDSNEEIVDEDVDIY